MTGTANATVGPSPLFPSSDTDAERYWGLHRDRLEPNPRFRARFDRLRAHARGDDRQGYPRTTGPLDEKSYAELPELGESGWKPDRPRQWPEQCRLGSDPELGNDHVARHLTSLSALAGEYLGATAAATALHELVRGSGYQLALPHDVASWPYPTGPTASTIGAYFTGASWGLEPQSSRRAWQRWKLDAFRVCLDPRQAI